MSEYQIPIGLSRKEFLKLCGLGFAVAFLHPEETAAAAVESESQDISYGRVADRHLTLYEQPAFTSRQLRQFWQDTVLPLSMQVSGQETEDYGPEWYQIVDLGYAHASALQPVEFHYQQPTEEISRQGTLAEVTVPFVDVYEKPASESRKLYRYYYGSTHWVNRVATDSDGQVWYRVMDDKYETSERWTRATRLRVIPKEELAPISPEVPPEEKRILVNLDEQSMTAYEYDKAVFTTLVSTGNTTQNGKWLTPTGHYRVGFKRASQHMMARNRNYGDYDLPGVPWVCYFTLRDHAFHGAYWHNGFGRRRSHGCVNLRPQDARWVFLWTTPVVQAHDQMEYAETGGTSVEVI